MASFCSNCGTPLPENSKFCPSCGKSVEQQTNTNIPPAPAPCPPASSEDKKTVAGILAILIGGLGIHYFYIGKTTAGILTILLSLCTCYIWSLLMFIQGIMFLTMSNAEFNERYVNTPKSFPVF